MVEPTQRRAQGASQDQQHPGSLGQGLPGGDGAGLVLEQQPQDPAGGGQGPVWDL